MADGRLAQVLAHLLTSGLGLSNSRVIVSFWGLLQATKERDSFSSALLCQIPESCHLSPESFSLSCLPTIHNYFPILQSILVLRQDKFRLSDMWLFLIRRAPECLTWNKRFLAKRVLSDYYLSHMERQTWDPLPDWPVGQEESLSHWKTEWSLRLFEDCELVSFYHCYLGYLLAKFLLLIFPLGNHTASVVFGMDISVHLSIFHLFSSVLSAPVWISFFLP